MVVWWSLVRLDFGLVSNHQTTKVWSPSSPRWQIAYCSKISWIAIPLSICGSSVHLQDICQIHTLTNKLKPITSSLSNSNAWKESVESMVCELSLSDFSVFQHANHGSDGWTYQSETTSGIWVGELDETCGEQRWPELRERLCSGPNWSIDWSANFPKLSKSSFKNRDDKTIEQ